MAMETWEYENSEWVSLEMAVQYSVTTTLQPPIVEGNALASYTTSSGDAFAVLDPTFQRFFFLPAVCC
jgi:hypothetical protein